MKDITLRAATRNEQQGQLTAAGCSWTSGLFRFCCCSFGFLVQGCILVLPIFLIVVESRLSDMGFKTHRNSIKNYPQVGPGGVSGGSWELLGALGVLPGAPWVLLDDSWKFLGRLL